MIVPAEEVEEGDFIPGLDDGYVFMDPRIEDTDGTVPTVKIYFHDADGEECKLVCSGSMPITVKRHG